MKKLEKMNDVVMQKPSTIYCHIGHTIFRWL